MSNATKVVKETRNQTSVMETDENNDPSLQEHTHETKDVPMELDPIVREQGTKTAAGKEVNHIDNAVEAHVLVKGIQGPNDTPTELIPIVREQDTIEGVDKGIDNVGNAVGAQDLVTGIQGPNDTLMELGHIVREQDATEVDKGIDKVGNTVRAHFFVSRMKNPTFGAYDSQDPVLFLYILQEYIKHVNGEDRAVEIAYSCLTGIALERMQLYSDRSTFDNFERDFRRLFLNFPEPISKKKWKYFPEIRRIFNGTWSATSGISMEAYFADMVKTVKGLQLPITEKVVMGHIMKHFPLDVQIAWYSRDGGETYIEGAKFLLDIENILLSGETDRNIPRLRPVSGVFFNNEKNPKAFSNITRRYGLSTKQFKEIYHHILNSRNQTNMVEISSSSTYQATSEDISKKGINDQENNVKRHIDGASRRHFKYLRSIRNSTKQTKTVEISSSSTQQSTSEDISNKGVIDQENDVNSVDLLGPEDSAPRPPTKIHEAIIFAYNNMIKCGWLPGQGLGKTFPGRLQPLRYKHNNFLDVEFSFLASLLNVRLSMLLEIREDKTTSTVVEGTTVPSTKNQDRIDQVHTGNEHLYCEEKEERLMSNLSPEVPVRIGNFEVTCLIDTRFHVSCISESLHSELLKIGVELPTIPISSLQGFTGSKIDTAVLVPANINEITIEVPCLVVNSLIRPFIIGFQWLQQCNAIIECGSKQIKLEYQCQTLVIDFKNTNSVEVRKVIKQEVEYDLYELVKSTNVDRGNLDQPKITYATEAYIVAKISEMQKGEENKDKLIATLKKNRLAFAQQPGRTDKYFHDIKMINEDPFQGNTKPIQKAHRCKIEEKLKELEVLGIIKIEETPYKSPLSYVMEEDGSVKISLNATELNKRIMDANEAPPTNAEILESFHGVKFISLIDLNNIYHQIPLSPHTTKYTGFTFLGKSYTYKVLSQELKMSSETVSKAMDIILGPDVRKFCVYYLDNLVVFTTEDSIDQHMEHLDKVLTKLREANITCGLAKCYFMHPLKLLGHIVSKSGVDVDLDIIRAIIEFPEPKSGKQLQSFLDLVNYYQIYFAKLSPLTNFLRQLLQKEKEWKWGETERVYFKEIKQKFLNTILLTHPNVRKDYYLQTEVSNISIGGCLYQIGDKGEQLVVALCTKELTQTELQWRTTERQIWAVVYCLQKFSIYLRSAQVTIRTRHSGLNFSFINNWKCPGDEVKKWMTYLQQFRIEIVIIKNRVMSIIDALLHIACNIEEFENIPNMLHPKIVKYITYCVKTAQTKLKDIKLHQKKDDELRPIIERLETGSNTSEQVKGGILQLANGQLVYINSSTQKQKLVVPKLLQEGRVQSVHEEMGHLGKTKIQKHVNDLFYFKNLSKIVKSVIRKCDLCQKTKCTTQTTTEPCEATLSEHSGNAVVADLYGPLPPSDPSEKLYICVLQDSFSKYLELHTLNKGNSSAVLNCIRKLRAKLKIKRIVTDNLSQFNSKTWKRGLAKLGIQKSQTIIKNRAKYMKIINKELDRLLSQTQSEKSSLKLRSTILRKIEDSHNNTVQNSTGFTPNEVLKAGIDLNSKDTDVKQTAREILDKCRNNLNQNATSTYKCAKFDKPQRIRSYKIGDFVKLKKGNCTVMTNKDCKNFSVLYEGPFKIGAVIHTNNYLLVDPLTGVSKGFYNAIDFKKYYTTTTPLDQNSTVVNTIYLE